MTSTEALHKCARLLSRSSTDDEKFAGLMLIPRIIKPDDVQSIEYIFNAMDITFLERLLRTGAKQAGKDGLPMLSIAIHVIDFFASHKSIARNEKIVDRVRSLYNIVALGESSGVLDDATEVLFKIMDTDPAVERVLETPDMAIPVIEAMSKSENVPDKVVYSVDYTLNQSSEYIASASNAKYIPGFLTLLYRVSKVFHHSHILLKIKLIQVITCSLIHLNAETAGMLDHPSECMGIADEVILGCVSILRQKSESSTIKDQAFTLAFHIIRLWGSHVFTLHDDKKKEFSKAKTSELLVRLACVEGQASVDTMMIVPPDNKGKSAEGVSTEKKRIELGWKLPFCATIAAMWVQWVSETLETEEPDESGREMICRLMGEMQKLVASIVSLLVDWEERAGDAKKILAESSDMVMAILQLLGYWLSTDPKMHANTIKILPMLTTWIGDSELGEEIRGYFRSTVSFALETCEVDESQYLEDLKTRELNHSIKSGTDSSAWVGTMEFDDFACAVYGIPSDEQILKKRGKADV